MNEKPDQSTAKDLCETNETHKSSKEKNFVRAKEEPKLARESIEKNTRVTNSAEVDTRDIKSVDKEIFVVKNEISNHQIDDVPAVDVLNCHLENFKVLSQYLSVDLRQFKSLRGLLNSYVGNKRNRLRVFNRIKSQCQTYGEIYESIQGRLMDAALQNIVNQIFVSRAQLWKEIKCGEKLFSNSKVSDKIESAKKLVDRIVEFLEQFKTATDLAVQSLYLVHKLIFCNQTEVIEDFNSVYKEYIDNLKSSNEKLNSCIYIALNDDVKINIVSTHSLICTFFNEFNDKWLLDFFEKTSKAT